MENFNIEESTIRTQITTRGGGIEISLDTFMSPKYIGEKMTAYQNYLGGGMLGSISNDCTVKNWNEHEELVELANELSKHYYKLCNGDEFEFDEVQSRSSSAY